MDKTNPETIVSKTTHNQNKIDLNSKVKDVSLQVQFDSENNLFELIILCQDQGREFKIVFNAEFMDSIDALVMGRKTYEKVLSFDCDWPYSKKVFVLSNSLKSVESSVEGKVEIIKGKLKEIIEKLNKKEN